MNYISEKQRNRSGNGTAFITMNVIVTLAGITIISIDFSKTFLVLVFALCYGLVFNAIKNVQWKEQ